VDAPDILHGGGIALALFVLALRALPSLTSIPCTLAILGAMGWLVGRDHDRLAASALTDTLTGLRNRRYLTRRFAQELERLRRYGTPLSLLLIDVDRLKLINDRYGHAGGDAALRSVAHSLETTCRGADVVARFGGDEFAVMLPSTSAAEAAILAERLLSTVERDSAPTGRAISVSVGVAEALPGDTADEVCEAADRALYRSKWNGRRRVTVAGGVARAPRATLTRLRLV
jgi:diguanylate cyclase (GGDEF)-like protein